MCGRHWGNTCFPQQCISDKSCQLAGDAKAKCDMNTNACMCSDGYGHYPNQGICSRPKCRNDNDCRTFGDDSAYCKAPSDGHQGGACRCDVAGGYANFPYTSVCQIPPWVHTM